MTGISIIIICTDQDSKIDRLLTSFLDVNTHESVEFIIINHCLKDDINKILSKHSHMVFLRFLNYSDSEDIDSLVRFSAKKATNETLLFIGGKTEFTTDILSILKNKQYKKIFEQSRNDDETFLAISKERNSKIKPESFLIVKTSDFSKNVITKNVQYNDYAISIVTNFLVCKKNDIEKILVFFHTSFNKSNKECANFEQIHSVTARTTFTFKDTPPPPPLGYFKKNTLDQSKKIFKEYGHVKNIKMKMLNLGFVEKASHELEYLATSGNSNQRQAASWELAVWNANKHSKDGAQACLEWLTIHENCGNLSDTEKDFAAILAAESQNLLQRPDTAKDILMKRLDEKPTLDIYLALSHYSGSIEEKKYLINIGYNAYGLSTIYFNINKSTQLYDQIQCEINSPTHNKNAKKRKVSIIIPSFNAECTLETTINSLLNQTWKNIEIIIADDCSTDNTYQIAKKIAKYDNRVKFVQTENNGGPYIARNLALNVSDGEFITCNDSDDWSHPQKIEIQVSHLMANPDIKANTSPQARATNSLLFFRRGNPGFYIQPNMSSLMFHRKLISKIGYWDSVRFAADSEYTRRIRHYFGKDAIYNLATAPMSFQRQTDDCLTSDKCLGYHGYKMGARKTYEDFHRNFHLQNKKIYIDFPLQKRLFPIPNPLRPKRLTENEYKFDVIIVSDFRLPGGTTMSNAEEIKAQYALGLRTGIVQMSRYDMNPQRTFNPCILKLVESGQAHILVYGETASCDLLILRLPWILQEKQQYIPNIQAKEIKVIVNQPPKRDYSKHSKNLYHIPRCSDHLYEYFGMRGMWHPIGPLVRKALLEHHADEIKSISLSNKNWHNIINVDEWSRKRLPYPHNKIRICRHSRDQYVKWPDNRKDLLSIYPQSEMFEIHVLGGATTPKQILGGNLPNNWSVTDFGNKDPQSFLADKDVFVYYTHPKWIESFGRVIIEAMAVGLPVFLPPEYEKLFNNAAVYAKPKDVAQKILAIMADKSAYRKQVQLALEYVKKHFGYNEHARRIKQALNPTNRNDHQTDTQSKLSKKNIIPILNFLSIDNNIINNEVNIWKNKSDLKINNIVYQLVSFADEAKKRGPFSVTDKTTLPPSGKKQDYWHPAPYWWPNPRTADGLPYIKKDGERIPGTRLYEPESDMYDRTRLQRVFDDTFVLAISWKFTGEISYAKHASSILYHFFINQTTRMNPHLKYGQVRMGHKNNLGSPTGLIEMKDMYFYLDAVKFLHLANAISKQTLDQFRKWLGKYLKWLLTSSQGKSECRSKNNHGTCYDLQVASIASFLGKSDIVYETLARVKSRIPQQFAPDGSQPEELARTTTAHYCCFNFQSWINLAKLAKCWGVDLWDYTAPNGAGLKQGARWLLSHMGKTWPFKQIDEFDNDRFYPIYFSAKNYIDVTQDVAVDLKNAYDVKPIFFPHDGIRPFWNLGNNF